MLVFHIIICFNAIILFFYFFSLFFANFVFFLLNFTSSNKDNDEESDYEEACTEFCPEESDDQGDDLVADILGGEILMFMHSTTVPADPWLVEEESYPAKYQKEDVFTARVGNSKSPSLKSLSKDCYEEMEDDPFELPSFQTKLAEKIPYHEILFSEGAGFKVVEDICPKKDDEKLANDEICFDSIKEDKTSGIASKGCAKIAGIEAMVAGSFFNGSTTSDSSRDWRSSTNLRDTETEDPFSSSSRWSSSRWENCTVYKKYDEEMMFLDRVSAQKLAETESLRSFDVNPKWISHKIVRKITKMSREMPKNITPFQELEAAYVAQVCLAWEALHWNYNNIRQIKTLSSQEKVSGCPAHVAQQFQQFEVLLQRFIEIEPFESGRRPVVYARIRKSSPKLLQVPEFHVLEEDTGSEESVVSIDELLLIVEDGMRTFMSFLKADKESLCQIIRAHFKKYQGLVDPNLVMFLKRAVKRREMQIKDLKKRQRCFRKRKLKDTEMMDILMGLIDLKVVSRVLRMSHIREEQVHWCEDKISKIGLRDGKLIRDSSTLFFPAQ